MHSARFPVHCDLTGFDFDAPVVDKKLVHQLATLEFVPVHIEPSAVEPPAARDLEVELRRGAVTMKIIWPSSASADLAVWTRELLRRSASMPYGWQLSRWTCEPGPRPPWLAW